MREATRQAAPKSPLGWKHTSASGHLTFRYESIFKASERARERTNIRE